MHMTFMDRRLIKSCFVGVLFVTSILLTGCALLKGVMSSPTPGTTPVFNQMRSQAIEFERADGSHLRVTAKIADDEAKQEAGFQNISPALIHVNFILFVFAEPLHALFHMHNVQAPLDIAFIASDGSLMNIQTMEVGPILYGPDEPFQYALEARSGFFAVNNLIAKMSKLVISSLNQK